MNFPFTVWCKSEILDHRFTDDKRWKMKLNRDEKAVTLLMGVWMIILLLSILHHLMWLSTMELDLNGGLSNKSSNQYIHIIVEMDAVWILPITPYYRWNGGCQGSVYNSLLSASGKWLKFWRFICIINEMGAVWKLQISYIIIKITVYDLHHSNNSLLGNIIN